MCENNKNMKKVAIVGFGGMGSWHVNKIKAGGAVELAGIWDISEERRRVASEQGIHVYSSLDDLLSDKTVDLVTVAVPNELHLPICVQVMEAGKNVICEKPVALNSDELAQMIECSRRTGKLFTTHQNRRWDCDYLLVKDLYASTRIGNIFRIESRYFGSRGIPGDWRQLKAHGGGMMLDWGVHLIDQITQMVYDKKIESVYCVCEHLTNDEVDDGFKLDLNFEGGLVARIEVGTSYFIHMPRFYVAGDMGSATVDSWNDPCHVVSCKLRDEKNVTPVVTAAGLTKTMAPRDRKTVDEYDIPSPSSDVHDFYRNVCRAIDGEEKQLITHDQLMRVMKIMEAAFKSDEIHAPVKIDDVIC